VLWLIQKELDLMLNAALCAAGIGSRRIEQPAKAAQKELFEYNGNGWTVCL